MEQKQTQQRGCKVSPCTCKNEGQDQLHGAWMHVKNPCKGASEKPVNRYTVCGKVE